MAQRPVTLTDIVRGHDADRLLNLIQRVLAAASGTGTVHQSRLTENTEAVNVPHDVRPGGIGFHVA